MGLYLIGLLTAVFSRNGDLQAPPSRDCTSTYSFGSDTTVAQTLPNLSFSSNQYSECMSLNFLGLF